MRTKALLLLFVMGCDAEAGWEPETNVESSSFAVAMGTNELNDFFGWSFAAGDFDADGHIDLAVGAPGEAPGSEPNSGAVYLFRGSGTGLVPWRVLTQETKEQYPDGTGVPNSGLGTNDADDFFGRSLVAADLDHDGVTDLAVGASNDLPFDGQPRCGAVYFFAGRKKVAGSASNGPQPWFLVTQNSILFSTVANQTGDLFGYSMVAGDFNGDGKTQLAISAPGKSGGKGRVYIVSAAGVGYWPTADQTIDMTSADVPASGDNFGLALAAGTIDSVAGDELAVGAPGHKVDGVNDAGKVFLYKKGGSGLTRWSTLVASVAGTGTLFGYGMDIGNVDGASTEDLVISVAGNSQTLIFKGNGNTVPAQWKVLSAGGTPVVGHLNSSTGPEDLIVGNKLFLGNVNGPTLHQTIGGGSQNLNASTAVIADFNGNNENEIVIGDPSHTIEAYAAGAASRLGRNASGTFVEQQAFNQETP